MDREEARREVGAPSVVLFSICSQKIRHFLIIKGTEFNRKHAHSQFQRTCPAKGKEYSETREVKVSDLIPPEHPELKVTVTWLPSIILTNFRKTKAASDALQCPDTSENQILKINQAGKAQFHVGQLYIWDETLGGLRPNSTFSLSGTLQLRYIVACFF